MRLDASFRDSSSCLKVSVVVHILGVVYILYYSAYELTLCLPLSLLLRASFTSLLCVCVYVCVRVCGAIANAAPVQSCGSSNRSAASAWPGEWMDAPAVCRVKISTGTTALRAVLRAVPATLLQYYYQNLHISLPIRPQKKNARTIL